MAATPVMGGRIQALRAHPSYKWLVLGTVGMGTLTSSMDGSITNIALPTLAETFHTDAGTILWVTVAFLLPSIGLMLSLGRLGDMIGRKRVLLAGFITFTAGLVFAPFSQSLAQLLAARIVQGIGQAMITSNGNALIVDAFPANERGRALGTSAAIVGLGLTSGPPLGGFLLDLLGWRSLFYTRAPFVVLFLVLTAVILRSDSRSPGRVRFDFAGALTLFVGLAAFLLTVNRGPKIGWTDPLILALGAVTVLSAVVFMVAELKVSNPVLRLSLFRSRLFSMANGTNLFQFLSQGAITILMPFLLLRGLGLTASHAGLVLITLPAVRLVIAPLAGWAADKVPSRVICTAGLLVMVVGYAALRTVGLETPVALLVTFLLLEGFGTAVFQPGNNSAIFGSVPSTHLGTASGMIATVRETGQATGIALAGTLYAALQSRHQAELAAGGMAPEAAQHQAVVLGFQQVMTAMLVFVVAATIVSALRGPDRFAGRTSEREIEGHGAAEPSGRASEAPR
ncbi:MAG: MFS transporter [Chloroflexi bacterium]|nr:MFS transporter [Chloroflexota bacterium]